MVKDAGVGLVIVGSWHGWSANTHARYNLGQARSVGLLTATYAYITEFTSGADQIEQAKAACGPEWGNCLFCAVDAERSIHGVPWVSRLRDAVDRAAELRAKVLYTRRNWWREFTNDSHMFLDCGLWSAHYDYEDDIDPIDYGGWPWAIGEQFTDTMTFIGVSCDLNAFDDNWIAEITAPLPQPEPPEEPVNPNLWQQIHNWQCARLVTGEDTNSWPEFRQHLIGIGAPDPGEYPEEGFALPLETAVAYVVPAHLR